MEQLEIDQRSMQQRCMAAAVGIRQCEKQALIGILTGVGVVLLLSIIVISALYLAQSPPHHRRMLTGTRSRPFQAAQGSSPTSCANACPPSARCFAINVTVPSYDVINVTDVYDGSFIYEIEHDAYAFRYICQCPPGFAGANCTKIQPSTKMTPCYRAYCYFNATCNNATRSCTCPPGMTGTQCDNDIDECSSGTAMCATGLTCTNTWGSYVCSTCVDQVCPGENLCSDTRTCAASSRTTGVCTASTTTGYTCTCKPGFSGFDCSSDINECALNSAICNNGGQCLNMYGSYNCICPVNYSGQANTNCASATFCQLPPNNANFAYTQTASSSDNMVYLSQGSISGSLYSADGTFRFMYGPNRVLGVVLIGTPGQPVAGKTNVTVQLLANETIVTIQVLYATWSPMAVCKITYTTSRGASYTYGPCADSGKRKKRDTADEADIDALNEGDDEDEMVAAVGGRRTKRQLGTLGSYQTNNFIASSVKSGVAFAGLCQAMLITAFSPSGVEPCFYTYCYI